MPPGPEQTFRLASQPLAMALRDLERRGIVRDARVASRFAEITGRARPVREGTFRASPGMNLDEVLARLRNPIRQMVRLPEGWWVARTAKLLEDRGVCSADEYEAWSRKPGEFAMEVEFDLPKGSLEGYLFPDTYDLPPLLGARETIRRQLRAFEAKVVRGLKPGERLHDVIVKASMIELEAARDDERPVIAGVIENRLRIGMPLQIDATVLYAKQEWSVLPPGVVGTVDSAYNTYRIRGLPPGPIGSPSVASIRAALNPARHRLLYYVALPDRRHLFAETYAQHLQNIRTARRAKAAPR